jgi:hypothetical protein
MDPAIIQIDGYWLPMDREFILQWIENIPSFLQSHPRMFVGDLTGDKLGHPDYMCYVSKNNHDREDVIHRAYFQPYHLSDREPICGIEVNYRLPSCELTRVVVRPMSFASIFTP